ncbi:NAD(P)/FAD-dependent oxidoreductase [Curtobacterium sp. ISL-83]|uniref:FAD-dependent oxidoreductase n=1 Tax=Curtobacterium sp. ISL-83 TaxID=2819145 RepID=UPI001BEC71B1|nr:NAD(P)/FAD-dependent oxidoreductase [Curtobacterium sp. ISL-83]MBT2503579.1 FAD-dependent monooxygenase [Curtobacterium sp. ISL-83]
MPSERTDVLVVGGGPVGVFLAALLASAGVDVLVWERRSGPPEGSRAIGIHPPSLDAFATIDVLAPVLAEAALVRTGVATSRGRTLGTLSFAHASRTHPYVATLDQHRTESLLRARLGALNPSALRVGVTITGITAVDGGVDAAGSDPSGVPIALRARFVVGADGARSTVRDLLGIARGGREYPGRYAMGDFADPEDAARRGSALVDVGPSGVVESFPLPGGRRRYVALVGMSDHPDRSAHGDHVDASELAAIVRDRTGAQPDPGSCSMLSAFRARRQFAERVGIGRVVLVGDAAHEVSPIGGQGMNLGWLDAAALAPILVDAVRSGASGPWPAYARQRQGAARRAATQAEVNTALGRPAVGVALAAREALLRSALALPSAGGLASLYAMRWS